MKDEREGGGPEPEESFDELFERYYRPVSYFFANRGFSPEECRDLAQETFLGAYRGFERFRGEASVETWLFKIAGNIWRNALRSLSAEKRDAPEVSLGGLAEEGREIADDEPGRAAKEHHPLDAALADERVRLLRRAVGELPAKMRRCLLLRIDQDMKYREIAAVMQISIQTVKSQLFQAKERLKEELSDHFPELDP